VVDEERSAEELVGWPGHNAADGGNTPQPFWVLLRLSSMKQRRMPALMLAVTLPLVVLAGCAGGASQPKPAAPAKSPTASAAPSPKPVLGYRHLYRAGTGWGQIEPARLTLGHTAARYWFIFARLGTVSQIRWTNWGKAHATGRGLKVARKPGGGFYRRKVRVELMASGLATCPEAGDSPAYTQMRMRAAPSPHGRLSRHWRDWPLHILSTGNLCQPPYQPRPYVKPARNRLGIYFRGDSWNWRTDTVCVGPGKRLTRPDFALQYQVQYAESARGTIGFGFRNFSDHVAAIARGTAVPLRVIVADPAGRLASATISLTHYGLATATYPDDFYRPSDVGPLALGHRALAPGTYTMVVETIQGAQLACSGAFVRGP
jgi:hypothetical protein